MGMDPESVNELSRNFWNSAILRAGIKLGVFELLEQRPMTYQEVAAARLDASPRFVQAFLDACEALGLVETQGERYKNSPQASSYLVKGKPEYVGDLVLHITNHWESWGHLDQLVRECRTLLPFESGFVDAATYWTDYMLGQHNRAVAGQGRHLVESVGLEGKRNAGPGRGRGQLQPGPVRGQPSATSCRR